MGEGGERSREDMRAALHAYFEERCVTGLKVKADKFKKMAANDEACARLTEFVSNAECQRLLISEGPKELVCFDTPPASHKKKLLYFLKIHKVGLTHRARHHPARNHHPPLRSR